MGAWFAITLAICAATVWLIILLRGRPDPHHEFMVDILRILQEPQQNTKTATVAKSC